MSNNIDRRTFLKLAGAGAIASAAVAAGCNTKQETTAEGVSLGEVPVGKMTMRENLHGEQVSLLGYGCMRFPTIETNSEAQQNAPLDQDAINELVDYAIAHGVNLFDTAPPYCKGQSEHATGIALSRHKREDFFVSTKLSNHSWQQWSREASMAMYHNSMKELQVDYLDYYMLHSVGGTRTDADGNEVEPLEVLKRRFFDNGMLDFLCEEREKGRIHNLGFSYHGDISVFDYLLQLQDQGKYHWDHVLIQHNYVDWNHSKLINPRNTNSSYLYGELAKRNIPVFVMEPLLGGQLVNLNDHAIELLKERDPQASIASWAFRFAGQQPRILTVLSGMTYMEHLQDNIRTYSPLKPLNDEELSMLEDIADVFANFKTVPCTDCKYCMPCPYGIDIPGVFAHYNKCLNEGDVIMGPGDDAAPSHRKAFRQARRRFLVGYDRAIPSVRQADHCIGCQRCVNACPQGIDIPSQMVSINNHVEQLKQSM
ncbi:MAG: aldo/keto reductase [Bacteroidales bacterium]|nr:aldo/keto reductase [Bacteroidales bacterium]